MTCLTCSGTPDDDHCAGLCIAEPSGEHCYCWRALDGCTCCRCGEPTLTPEEDA